MTFGRLLLQMASSFGRSSLRLRQIPLQFTDMVWSYVDRDLAACQLESRKRFAFGRLGSLISGEFMSGEECCASLIQRDSHIRGKQGDQSKEEPLESQATGEHGPTKPCSPLSGVLKSPSRYPKPVHKVPNRPKPTKLKKETQKKCERHLRENLKKSPKTKRNDKSVSKKRKKKKNKGRRRVVCFVRGPTSMGKLFDAVPTEEVEERRLERLKGRAKGLGTSDL